MFGKWHLGSPNTGNNMSQDTLPLAHGFDKWIGTNVSHDYNNSMLIKSDLNGNTPIKGYTTIAKNLPSDTKASEKTPLLFQVEQDLGERFNRTAETPEFVAKMVKTLLAKKAQIRKEGTYWQTGH